MQDNPFHDVLVGRSLPAAWVDLDAFNRNMTRVASYATRAGKSVRLASKSVRHIGLMKRVLNHESGVFQGVLCFTVDEAAWLYQQGFDDLVVAYPSVNPFALAKACAALKDGACLRLMVDDVAHLDAIHHVATRHDVQVPVVLDIDVGWSPLGVTHVGARRSPLRTVKCVKRLIRSIREYPMVHVDGVMTYESQIAGVPDAAPGRMFWNALVRNMKRVSNRDISDRRREIKMVLEEERIGSSLFNGGGTGSLHTTLSDATVTEVTVGSGFLGGTVFDHYEALTIDPALFFALEVCRIPEPGWITCLGGGPLASGPPAPDRLPRPIYPPGLRISRAEGVGEVQTPMQYPMSYTPEIGQPVVFRPPKSGELGARFTEYLMVENGVVTSVEQTYRGMGVSFL